MTTESTSQHPTTPVFCERVNYVGPLLELFDETKEHPTDPKSPISTYYECKLRGETIFIELYNPQKPGKTLHPIPATPAYVLSNKQDKARNIARRVEAVSSRRFFEEAGLTF